nr:molybdate ABC transporter substrate-binding protein [Ktedonobacterales bacterium]
MQPLRRTLMLLMVALPLALAACGGSSSAAPATSPTGAPITLNVFAAASLTGAFKDAIRAFEKTHTNVTVVPNFGGSNTLAQQITNGAPADVFASANTTQMTVVVTGGAVDQGAVKNFARNKLVIITPKANIGKITQPQDLAKAGLKIVLGAKGVPVGDYGVQFLANASKDPSYGAAYQANVLKNVVSYETDVKAVLNKVQLGEADAGIVYTTDAATAAGAVSQITIPDTLNVIATYPIAPIKASAHLDVANQFVSAILAAED